MTLLQHELDIYEAHRNDLLSRARGMFVLIKGDRLVDIFACEEDAVRRGYQEFGNVPFLVKRVLDVEVPITLTRPAIIPASCPSGLVTGDNEPPRKDDASQF